jgi:hypothetical protein
MQISHAEDALGIDKILLITQHENRRGSLHPLFASSEKRLLQCLAS